MVHITNAGWEDLYQGNTLYHTIHMIYFNITFLYNSLFATISFLFRLQHTSVDFHISSQRRTVESKALIET